MTAIGLISLALFVAATILIWRYMAIKSSGQQIAPRLPFLTSWAAALIAMLIYLSDRLFLAQGLDLSFYNSLLIAAFVVCTLLFLTSTIKPMEYLGLIVLPVTIICLGLNIFLLRPGTPLSLSTGIQTHIISSIIAFSILCLAAVQAILLLLQERKLKHHTAPGILRALPSLHENEMILFQSIGLGVLILSIALASGFIYLDDIFAQHLVHKTTLSVLAWIIFVVLLWGRIQFGWRGPTAVRWTLGGFSFLILAYFGSKFVLELILYRV